MQMPLTKHIEKDGFRLRGLHFSRVDAFSDVVFGFALTLLVVSLEVPKTFAELHETLRGFLPFAISFAFLMLVWVAHYKFFRRFGLHDFGTVTINGVLLFFVLFFVYPLKFLFTFAVFATLRMGNGFFDSYEQIAELMLLFGVGFSTIYFLVAGLYWNAWRQRATLELTPLERVLTKSYIAEAAGVAAVGVMACGVAWWLPARYSAMSGWVYLVIAAYRPWLMRMTRKKAARVAAVRVQVEHDPEAAE